MIKNISIFLIIVFTLLVSVIKPKLNKTVLFSAPFSKSEPIEETQIDWSSWHSNILNKILIDAKNAPVNQPPDTLNYIEFDVDSAQNIVNIKIYTEPIQYSQEARNYFSPFVRALNTSDVLKFPKNSQRKLAHFKAILVKSKKTELSTPKDFMDYETVRVNN